MSNFYGESFQDKLRGMLRNTPWWAISLLVHGVILTFAYGYTWEIPLPKDEVRIDTSIREKLELPPVMLDLPKPVTEDQKIQPKRITDVKRVQLSQKDLPQLEDILKKRATPNPGMAVLAAPGGVMRVGSIGEGTGFHLAGGLDGAIGDMSGWPGWRERCLAVWLFDESKSMKDDQQIVRQKVDELYESLGIDLGDSRQKMRIVTAVASYGKDFHIVLKEPTTDMDKVRAAIDRIRVDDSGKENYLMAINRVLTEYARYARKYSRNKLAGRSQLTPGADPCTPEKDESDAAGLRERSGRVQLQRRADLRPDGAEGRQSVCVGQPGHRKRVRGDVPARLVLPSDRARPFRFRSLRSQSALQRNRRRLLPPAGHQCEVV